jgi:hypothetical protein
LWWFIALLQSIISCKTCLLQSITSVNGIIYELEYAHIAVKWTSLYRLLIDGWSTLATNTPDNFSQLKVTNNNLLERKGERNYNWWSKILHLLILCAGKLMQWTTHYRDKGVNHPCASRNGHTP